MAAKKEADSRFQIFGTVSFTSTTKVNDFIDHLKTGKIMGTHCKKCETHFFPPRADCCQCLTSNMSWFEISGTGKLITYSRLTYAPIGFDDDLPYAIALLDFGEVKVFGRIASHIPEEEIKIGMPMKIISNTLSNGQLNYVFQKA